jgi:two-component system, cell cycle response regulator DivK
VTANVLSQDEARARAAGFDGFIGKPLNFDRFPQQILALLKGESVWMPR